MKSLSQILVDIDIVSVTGDTNKKIAAVYSDSRKVNKNSMFIAVRGNRTDGHYYINDAITNGAHVIVCETIPAHKKENITYIQVKNAKQELAKTAAIFYDYPSRRLQLIGVTGTNGKTTIATLLHSLFQYLGYKSGLLSTVANYVNTKKFTTTHTTLDVLSVNQLLDKMVKNGCQYCFMEVSSHAIDQKRIGNLFFKGGIFTNITHDHLDYHKSFKKYLYTKKQYFDQLSHEAFAISNADDKNGRFILQNTHAKKYYYSIRRMKDFHTRIIEKHFDGTLIEIDKTEVWTRFSGCFNISNLLAVYTTARLLGVDKENAIQALSVLSPVRGRFETIVSDTGIKAVIDYAHTPDALKNILQSIQNLCKNGDRIITVVGAGGDRDKAKRPEMGKIAARYSDRILLTSDNPRSEDPEDIIMDMKAGIDEINLPKVIVIVDRKEAIRVACTLASRGDIILVAGKGHETYQEIKGEIFYLDDRELILENFKS